MRADHVHDIASRRHDGVTTGLPYITNLVTLEEDCTCEDYNKIYVRNDLVM